MKPALLLLIMALAPATLSAQKMNTEYLAELLKKNEALFADVLRHPSNHDVQILYTQIDRDRNHRPKFKSYSYRLDKRQYFYPASTVKFPAAIFALEKINAFSYKGIQRNTSLKIDSAFRGQRKVTGDKTSANGEASVEHYIKKLFLVSDNDAFNRLYEFLGRRELNRRMFTSGAVNSKIVHRLSVGEDTTQSRHTNPIRFFSADNLLHEQAAGFDPKDYKLPLKNERQGKGYIASGGAVDAAPGGRLVNEPFDFSTKNFFALEDQQLLLRKLFFPEAFPSKERFHLSPNDYQFLYRYMSMYPNESRFPGYDEKNYWPAYAKFLYYGSEKNAIPEPQIRIFNKIGNAYGYLIDNMYFVDFENKVEFMLSAVIHVNANGIFNDNTYEYDQIGYPFMKNLGRVIYREELNRKKKRLPDLSHLRLDYSK